jgi:hypothetical protein
MKKVASNMKYNLELTEQELNIIAASLYKLPYETVSILVENIRAQIEKQQTKKEGK